MIRLLRTLSTRRLLATLSVAVVAIGGGAAIAVAATSGGPVPKRESLARAIHQALSAPKLSGISAQISFTNHLISSSDLQGSDPILNGASGRLWYAPARHELRLELQSDNGDAQVLVRGRSFWVSDPSSHIVYEGTLPKPSGKESSSAKAQAIPQVAQIQADLNKLSRHVRLSPARPSDTGGAPTYTVRVSPRHDGGLLGAAQLAFDAARGVPLDFAVYASGDSTPVLELKATSVSFGSVSQSVFEISPPSGDKIVRISPPASTAADQKQGTRPLTGLSAVAKALPFKLIAPATLVGLPRHSVARLDWGGQAGALVTYGRGLGAIAVIEHAAGAAGSSRGSSSGGSMSATGGLSLPTVSIDGATGHELDTALGTMLTFTRGGVDYTVLGSVPPTAAEAAARAL
jgi:outer membrane lipoprotein-sorting protein